MGKLKNVNLVIIILYALWYSYFIILETFEQFLGNIVASSVIYFFKK